MAKPRYSQASTRANATDAKPNATKGAAQGSTRKQIPQARRGSVTKPVKKTPWTLIISGALGLAAVIFVVGYVIIAGRGTDSSTVVRPPPVASPVAGATAPDFKVMAKDGSTLTKADLAGKPTLMVFFASWCPHCQVEAPRIKDIAAKNPDVQVVFIGVSDRETTDDIYNFQQKFDLPMPMYADGGKAASAYGVSSYPTLMAVDKSGVIKSVVTGEQTPEALNGLIGKAKG